jgi:hypothetical protein
MTNAAASDRRSLADVPGASAPARLRRGGAAAPWLGLGATATAAALVFWLFDALPFQDLPAHAGLIALRHRLPWSPFEQRFFVLAPHLGPYSLFRSLGEALCPLFGPVGAVRVIATLPVIATPLSLLWARRRLHDDRTLTGAYFGLALGFGFMTLLGLASYLLGVALLVVGLTLWLELLAAVDRDRPSASRELAVACFALLLYVAHGHAFAIFVLLAGVAALATGRRSARWVRLRALAPAGALAVWMAWMERGAVLASGSVRPANPPLLPHFQGIFDKLSLLLTPTLATRTGLDVLVGLSLWAVLLTAAFATARSVWSRSGGAEDRADRRAVEVAQIAGASMDHSRALLACFAALAAVFFALPHSIGWFGFVDGRLVPLLLLVAVMALRREALGPLLARMVDRSAPLAACAIIAIMLAASYLFQREARGFREVLAGVPAEARLLNLPLDPNSRIFTAHPFVHYDKLALADRPVVVSDLWFHQGSAVYPTAANPALELPASYSESDLRSIDWPAYHLRDWDYVLIRTRPESEPPAVPPSLALTAHRGGWWLFSCGHGSSAPAG